MNNDPVLTVDSQPASHCTGRRLDAALTAGTASMSATAPGRARRLMARPPSRPTRREAENIEVHAVMRTVIVR